MKNKLLVLLLAGGVSLLFTTSASATLKNVGKCTQTVKKEYAKLISAKQKNYAKCIDAWEKCQTKSTPSDVTACEGGLTAAGGKCSAAVLDSTDITSKVGKKFDKFGSKVAKKCGDANLDGTADDPSKLTTAEVLDSATGTGLFDNAAFGAILAAECGSSVSTVSEMITCLKTSASSVAEKMLQVSDPRAYAALAGAGVIGTDYDPVPIGKHAVVGITNATLTTASIPVALTGIPLTMTLDVGAVGTDGVADIVAPVSGFTAAGTLIGPFGLFVCTDSSRDTVGKLCCSSDVTGLTDCSGAVSATNYLVEADHDNSGANVGFGFLTGEVTGLAGDPTCSITATNSLAGLPAEASQPCAESFAFTGACNNKEIGSANTKAHYPRCDAGSEAGDYCDPTDALGDECPGGGTFCASQSPALPGVPLAAAPCNSAQVLTTTGGTFGDGDMILKLPIQFTLHSLTLDTITFPSGCANGAGDSIPDGYGCDGIPCNADDTTVANDESILLLTTGTAAAKVYDANMVPTGFGGLISVADGGAVPADPCQNLSVGVATGYKLVAAFTGMDDNSLGDTTTSIDVNMQ